MLEIIGTIFIIVVGSLGHFLYEWTNKNKIVGYFAAVNESTWEHIKLVILPTFLWMMIEYHWYIDWDNYFFSRFIGLLVMIILIPGLFYGYQIIFRKNNFIVDILIFIVSVILGQFVFSQLVKIDVGSLVLLHIGIVGLISIFLIYMTRTYVPKKNFIFKDPVTKKYGINRRK